ncbi:MAG: DUF4423 domain-containing protein [Myxococcales bacterium]|nr:DUF4423 domain-containing protein [Myxococcales bacterium]
MAAKPETFDYPRVARELVKALRGRRSCAELSRRAGYRSNIVQRWESGHCYPTAARLLALQRRLRPKGPSWLERFFTVTPPWLTKLDDAHSPAAVAAFLTHLKGKTSTTRLAELSGHNRHSVARWLDGRAEPRLPDFLQLVDVESRRLLDLLASLEDPARLPSVRPRWEQHQRLRQLAYDKPFSHAVLRALELPDAHRPMPEQARWIAERLGVETHEVAALLTLLRDAGQVRRSRYGYRLIETSTVDTSRDPERARDLKVAWTETALSRLRDGAPGTFGYSLFAVSRADLERLRALQLEYARAMQDVIAGSSPSECVGLYCVQLFDLHAGAVEPAGEAPRDQDGSD